MKAVFIAAFLILGTLTLGAMAHEDTLKDLCLYNECDNDNECGPSDDCVCIAPRGDDYRKFCGKRTF
uniref:Putative ixodegrin protein n=1 Tax=Ixodes ricinus TaxID=34613 RepID=A0A0K8RG79_IXORI